MEWEYNMKHNKKVCHIPKLHQSLNEITFCITISFLSKRCFS